MAATGHALAGCWPGWPRDVALRALPVNAAEPELASPDFATTLRGSPVDLVLVNIQGEPPWK
eukprot:15438014-Alexandrium_andersonii.AAC.1